MSENGQKTYEGMFVFAQAQDLGEGVDRLDGILKRASADIISMSKWDERRFAFPIEKHKRGVYVLAYFSCDPTSLVKLERDCNLSEEILRHMVTKADHLTEEEMKSSDAREALVDEVQLRRERAEARAAARAATIEEAGENEPEPDAESGGAGDAAEAGAEKPSA